MSTEKQTATVMDLVEEAKKRIVLLIVCLVGLSYLMSLTSSSVLVNLPAAGLLIILIRYISLDFEMKRRALTFKNKTSSSTNNAQEKKTLEKPRAKTNEWRQKVSSPVVEDALDQFTRHIVSEWVTDLWYSRITPDKQGPEELVLIINGVLAEISRRSRNINLITLLTRDIVNLICTNLELFRATKLKIEKQKLKSLTIQEIDVEIKYVLAAEDKLHPALFSPEAEHKVLQHVMEGLISYTFKQEELQCSLFRYIVRELLACVVIRPVLNLASPRFINERIESLVLSLKKDDKGSIKAQAEKTPMKENESKKIEADDFSPFQDPSVKGVELVQLKKDPPKPKPGNGTVVTKDPLLSIDARSTRSWSSLPESTKTDEKGLQRHKSGEQWGDMLDMVSKRKTEVLAPEHFDDMWTKGRNFKSKAPNPLPIPKGIVKSGDNLKVTGLQKEKSGELKGGLSEKVTGGAHTLPNRNKNTQSHAIGFSYKEEDMDSETTDSKSESSYTTEDEDIGNITGLDSPGVKVWDGKNRRNVNHIHHPLENFDSGKKKKSKPRAKSKRKKSRLNSQTSHVWQEVERSSFLLEDGQNILNANNKNYLKYENSSDDSETEILNRIGSGANASSNVSSSASLPEARTFAATFSNAPIISDSFWKLRCEVSGANIVKSGSRTFAVYSISVTDLNNHSWSIKRRFQHFSELHRRLKMFQEYNLHLPPKHFLSNGLDTFVVQERCILLDKYLKDLLQLPTLSGSIEVWDFLSVDSQTYLFTDTLSILETLSVGKKGENQVNNNNNNQQSPKIQQAKNENEKAASRMMHGHIADNSKPYAKGVALPHNNGDSDEVVRKDEPLVKTVKSGNAGLRKSTKLVDHDDGTPPPLPSEWVPPNLTHPILELVDVIFQLQDGGWIRRKAFWVAKQVLQLGMGDAFDDWLIEKIQLLRRGPVVASGINRLETILWPDGIFITKHPRRQQPPSPTQNSPRGPPSSPLSSPTMQELEEIQQKEAERRAKLVYEMMIDKAPAAIVSVFGSKEYEQCAKDLYYFIQSSVAVKHLVLDILELLIVSAFPELEKVFKQIHEEKEKFGELKRGS